MAETRVIVQSWLKIVVLLQRISVFSFCSTGGKTDGLEFPVGGI